MTLMVYGVNCGWFDTIDKVGRRPLDQRGMSIPCCPYCKSVLFQIEENEWWIGVDKYEANGHPGYRKVIEWARGKHHKSIEHAIDAYNAAHPGAMYSS